MTRFLFSTTATKSRWLTLAAILYFATAKLGMALFSLQPNNITLLWLPSGIGLVMCLRSGTRALPFILLASFAANFDGMSQADLVRHVLHTSIAAAADSLAAWLAAGQMRRALPQGLTKVRNLFDFCLYVCLFPTLVSSLILATNLALGDYITWPATGAFVRMLLIADSLGILLVYPLHASWSGLALPSRREWRQGVIPTVLALAMIALAFSGYPGLIYLVLPNLLYLVFHTRPNIVTLALTLTVIGTVLAASHMLGPFHIVDSHEAKFMLTAFLFSTTLVVLGIVLQHRELTDTHELKSSWQYKAEHDPLTDLPNRNLFMPLARNEHERSRRTRQPFAIALLDLDHFKLINDRYGHRVGDEVLVAFARVMQAQLRGGDVAARIGGEEFAVLFPDSSLDEATWALERIRAKLAETTLVADDKTLNITVSGGLVSYRDNSEHIEQLLDKADALLYRAKESGRNRIISEAD